MSTSDTGAYDPQMAAQAESDDDWDDDSPIARRARMPWLTKLLIVGAVGVAAFAGGVFAQRHWGAGSTASAASQNGNAFAARSQGAGRNATGAQGSGRTGSGGSQGFGGAGGGFGTVGQVLYVKGNFLYVSDTSGNIVKVRASGAQVTKTVTTTVKRIRPGDTVVVRGQPDAKGTVRATNITLGAFGGRGSFSGGNGGNAP